MIEIEDCGRVRILRMARGKGNSMNLEFLEALLAAFDDAERAAVAGLVLTGSGAVFSAGVDLPTMVEGGRPYLEKFLPALSGFIRRAVTFPKPVVAAVNGHAIAGGCIAMLACDYRVATQRKVRMGITELLVGVPFPTWALEVVRFAVAPQYFEDLVYTGRTVQPDEARQMGLIHEIVEADTLLDRACAMAQQFASIPSEAFRISKQHLRRPLVETAERVAAAQDRAIMEIWCADATQQAVRQFVERTIKR